MIIEMKETAGWLDRAIDEFLMTEPVEHRVEDLKKIFEDCAWLCTVFERG